MINIYEYLLSKKNPKTEAIIEATDDNIRDIVDSEIKRLGFEASLNHIDVHKVTNMKAVFRFKHFNGDISEWDVSHVHTMDMMFQGCLDFNCDLGKWDVSNVTSMSQMFSSDTKFEGIGLEKWKLSPKIEYLDRMFIGCKIFNRDISSWKVTPGVRHIAGMFKNCEAFEQDLSSWEISQYTLNTEMFKNCPMTRKKKLQPKIV